MALPKHVMEAIHEAADVAVNPTGYAEGMDDSDERAEKRDRLIVKIAALVADELFEEPSPHDPRPDPRTHPEFWTE